MRDLVHLCRAVSKQWTIMPAMVVLSMLFTAPCSVIAAEPDDVPSILDRVRTRLTATTEHLKRFGVDPKMLVDGAVACGTGGAAGCAGYAAAEYINNLGRENDRLGAEAAAIRTTDPHARAKLDRIQARLRVIDRRIAVIETTTIIGRDGAIGCLTGGPAGCVWGASKSAAWLTAEKYAPPGYEKYIKAAALVEGLAEGGLKGGRGFSLPGGETARGLEGVMLGLSKSAAIEGIKKATLDVTPRLIQPIQAAFRPGGISLSKAAAERMALNIDIEAIAYRDGQIIITGAQDNATKIDAALFLTSMRLACSPGDPFFSLDPVDGKAWQDQSQAALDIAWKRMQGAITARLRGSQFDVQTFSVHRDFPSLWAEIGPQYPEIRSRLVFQPEWLSQTRFGEILYKADVLLKELTVGVSVVAPGGALRAAKIPGYIAPYKRNAARGLLVPEHLRERGWQGQRLWFDLMPQTGSGGPPAYEDPDANIDRRSNRALYAILKARGYVDPPKPQPLQKSTFYVNDGVADISNVFPKMFILRHDHVTGQDIPGANPDLDLLSADVNKRAALYGSAYQELRDLTDIFRAYIASTKVIKEDQQVCASVPPELASGEKLASALPQFHPSELFITVAYAEGVRRYSPSTSVSGGISLRGKQFYPQAVVEKETPLIAEIKRDLSAGVPAHAFKAASGRQYLAFDTREPPRRVPIVATGSDQ